MAPLGGLQGLYDDTPVGETGRDPTEYGAPSLPVHNVPGDASGQFPAGRQGAAVYPAVIPPGAEPEEVPGGGIIHDRTPNTHAAPTFRGILQDPVEYAEGSAELHGLDLGGSSLKDAVPPDIGTPEFTLNTGIGDSALARPPGQLATGTDVDQGNGVANSGTFAMWHQFRNWFKDPVPRAYGSVGERPFYGKHPVGTTTFDVDSAYGVQGDTSQGMNLGPTPTSFPNPYTQPPNPTVNPDTGYSSESPWPWEG